MICGLLNLNKPSGITSRDAVDRVSRPLRKVKVGHAGTLDPLASGVLVVAVGSATRLIEYVQRMTKTYRTTILLGATSDTLDADGTIVATEGATEPPLDAIESVLPTQVGLILQQPPDFSALKVRGQRAYDLARSGQTVELEARPVRIDAVNLIDYQWPRLELEVVCGSGTYIRSIARDIGSALGCGGLVEVLTRTRIGPFTIEEGLDSSKLTAESIPSLLRPALEALADLPKITISDEQWAEIGRGRSLPIAGIPSGVVALISAAGELVAIAESDFEAGRVHPRRVLAGAVS